LRPPHEESCRRGEREDSDREGRHPHPAVTEFDDVLGVTEVLDRRLEIEPEVAGISRAPLRVLRQASSKQAEDLGGRGHGSLAQSGSRSMIRLLRQTEVEDLDDTRLTPG
jgi:hypothetical protein